MRKESHQKTPNDNKETHREVPPTNLSNFESKFRELNESFENISPLEDSVSREYALIEEAKKQEIPVESYRRMFEIHCQTLKNAQSKGSLLKPVSLLDQRFGNLVEWLRTISLVKFSILIGEVTLLVAMISYVTESPDRQEKTINDARDIIKNRRDQVYSEARRNALELLNSHCAVIKGIQAPQASLPKIELNKCYKFQLNQQSFTQWPPQFYRYKGIDMSYGNLAGADLEGANLKGANLKGVNLAGANLEGANLEGANLEGANLEGANLGRSNLKAANLEGTNLNKIAMTRSNLEGAKLQNTRITNARLLWTNLLGANLAFSNLEGSNFSRAKLNNADLYNANLKGVNLSNADLTDNTILIGANLDNTNLHEAKLWSLDQIKRVKNWEKVQKSNEREDYLINQPQKPYKIGLIKYSKWSIFNDYQQGIAKVGGVQIITVESQPGIENEAQAIKKLQESDVDMILFRPQDPVKSAPAIREAYNVGIVPIALGDCLNPTDSKDYLFACYDSDSFQMGYDSALYLTKSASQLHKGKPLNIGLVDGANSQRIYPYFKGFMEGLNSSKVSWKIIGLTDAQLESDLSKVKEMLQNHPEINVIWGGDTLTTELAIQAVQELQLKDKILIYGIFDFSRDKVKLLLDPQEPLQLLVDENPKKSAEDATKVGISILNGKVTGYEYHLVPHRLLTQNDREQVQKLLADF